jgi:predicted dehydrogenase
VTRSLNAAIIGLGFVGKAHLEALRRLGIPVRGILGSSPARTAEAIDTLRLGLGYNSLDELLGDTDANVIHICTPNHLHYEQAKSALEAGKHVMCEKPLAMNTHELRHPNWSAG